MTQATRTGGSALAAKMEEASTAVAAPKGRELIDYLNAESTRRQLQEALPRQMDASRFVRVAATELRRQPKLASVSTASFWVALLQAAQLGLEPGPLGHAYLVPFRNTRTNETECQLILGYKGLIDLARRSGNIVNIVAREVREQDYFDFQYGLEEKLVHRPKMNGERGAPVAYYGVAHYRGGGHLILVLSKADVDRYRARSRSRNEGPWVTDYPAMALKTVIRRMGAFLPLSIQAQEAIVLDEHRELGIDSGDILDVAVQPSQDTQGEAPPKIDQPQVVDAIPPADAPLPLAEGEAPVQPEVEF